MSVFSSKSALALVVVLLGLGAPAAYAQAGPVPYSTFGWPLGFGGGDIRGGSPDTRYNFPNGMFIASESAPIGLGMSSFTQLGAFGNIGSLSSNEVKFGYNFQNAPLTVYGGFNTLKYTTGLGSPFAPFDTTSGTLPVYSARAGIEYRPTSNLSLSLGVGFTQQSGRIDSDLNSQPGASAFTSGRR